MPALICPRCQRANPDVAVFCYFDGSELRHVDGAGRAVQGRLAREFIFPSGRRCATFDDLAQGCQDEWSIARDLLRQGTFTQFFTQIGRADIVKAVQEAQAQEDPDIALIRFVNALPVSRPQAPRLDLNPRRFLLGNLLAGETRQLHILLTNQGQGQLQGTLKVTEGGQWLKIEGGQNGQCPLRIARDQKMSLQVDTRGMAAAQTYGGKLTVITNGGVVEVPVRMDLVAQPFPRAPFQGAKTPRDMAERMRSQPKAAVPLLENGEIARWFAVNGWNFPVRGTPARGVAGIQQFFEAMGLSKPPPVNINQQEVRFACTYPETLRFQLNLYTSSRKWVYASVESDCAWLKVLTPQVSGPQQAAVGLEVDSRHMSGGMAQGQIKIIANAGQTLTVRVTGELRGAPAIKSASFLRPIVVMVLGALLLRVALVPLVDLRARSTAARSAATRLLGDNLGNDSPLNQAGGWLALPWGKIWMTSTPELSASLFKAGQDKEIKAGKTSEFRHYYLKSFVRRFILGMSWLSALVTIILIWRRRESPGDILWGFIAGTILGIVVSATLACIVVSAEIPLQSIWVGGTGLSGLLLWIVVAVLYWGGLGAATALVFGWLPVTRRAVIEPAQKLLAGVCRLCRLNGLAAFCAGG